LPGISQQSVEVLLLNSKSLEPVSFATVKVLNTKVGTYSDENGKFSVAYYTDDILSINCVGFIKKETTLKGTAPDTVLLDPYFIELEQSSVGQKKLAGKRRLGISKVKRDVTWSPSGLGEEFAQLISFPFNGNQIFKVKRVVISAKNFNPTTPVVLHIYKLNEKSRLPGEELLQNRHLITSKNFKRRKLVIDLENENLLITDKSIFVSCEFLGSTDAKIQRSTPPPAIYMTFSAKEAFTFVRTLAQRQYQWFTFRYSENRKEDIKATNTIFSVEVEEYK
jgi:hypothetical protein